MSTHFDLTLYLVTEGTHRSEEAFLTTIEQALQGGVTLLQLREKTGTTAQILERAQKIKALADRYGVPLVIDDRVDIALAVDCAGVHLGQEDLSVSVARKILGPDKIIGATAKTVPDALRVQKEGADYLGVGAIYPTKTKVKTKITAVSTLNDIAAATRLPIVAIGGLDENNLECLKHSQASGIAVVRALMDYPDPKRAAQRLRAAIDALALKGARHEVLRPMDLDR
ncbi:Thiamin-phosphate pyrophosphorylase [Clostridiaceae bacterium JG1575]|nr:Thiamin-phosphate pyrophosphorylase [Clostridiaceae bacterium JG1575]